MTTEPMRLDPDPLQFPDPSNVPLWIATIDHKHGTNVYADYSLEGINRQLAAYCRECWEREVYDEDSNPVPLPQGAEDEDIILQYFEAQSHSGQPESYEVHEMSLPPPPPPVWSSPLAAAIKRMVDLSNSHVSREDGEILQRHGKYGSEQTVPRVVNHEHGWTLYICSDDVGAQLQTLRERGHSEAFLHLYRLVAELGGDVMVLNFDQDAATLDTLPTYDW